MMMVISTLILLVGCISILRDASSTSMLSTDWSPARVRLPSGVRRSMLWGSPPAYGTTTRLLGMLDDMIDISPANNGTLFKRIVKAGDRRKGFPLRKDNVDIRWKMFKADGSLIHDSSLAVTDDLAQESDAASPTSFNFQVCAEPRQVIRGWDIAVLTMMEGEVSRLIIHPELAFGEIGAPPLIPPNTTLLCDLELLRISPSPSRKFKTVRPDESIRTELMRQIESGDSPIARPVVHKQSSSSARNETGTEAKYFNPEVHKVNPRLQVVGETLTYTWLEDFRTMDVKLRLAAGLTKADLIVDISATAINVSLRGGEALLVGPLHGKVDPSETTWALVTDDSTPSDGGMVLQILLEKSFGSQDIWATLLNRDYLKTAGVQRSNSLEQGDGDGSQ